MPLVERVREEMKANGLSQAQVARESGTHATRLNQWLQGKYPGDTVSLEEALGKWLDARARQLAEGTRLPEAPAWVSTPTAQRILAALGYAQMAGDVSVVYGGAGLGKTQTARHYQGTAPNVWIATMTPATSTVAAALDRVCTSVGVRTVPQGANRMEAAIVERMRDTNGLLVIDEAQHMAHGAIEAVRSLQDATEVGLTIMGNEIVYNRLTGGTRQAHFAQLFSRIGRRLSLRGPLKEDVEAVCEAWGLTNGAKAMCWSIAKRPGALRGLTKCLRLGAMYAQGAGEQLASEHIKAAWRDLGGEEV
jgi:hypothetical protein